MYKDRQHNGPYGKWKKLKIGCAIKSTLIGLNHHVLRLIANSTDANDYFAIRNVCQRLRYVIIDKMVSMDLDTLYYDESIIKLTKSGGFVCVLIDETFITRTICTYGYNLTSVNISVGQAGMAINHKRLVETIVEWCPVIIELKFVGIIFDMDMARRLQSVMPQLSYFYISRCKIADTCTGILFNFRSMHDAFDSWNRKIVQFTFTLRIGTGMNGMWEVAVARILRANPHFRKIRLEKCRQKDIHEMIKLMPNCVKLSIHLFDKSPCEDTRGFLAQSNIESITLNCKQADERLIESLFVHSGRLTSLKLYLLPSAIMNRRFVENIVELERLKKLAISFEDKALNATFIKELSRSMNGNLSELNVLKIYGFQASDCLNIVRRARKLRKLIYVGIDVKDVQIEVLDEKLLTKIVDVVGYRLDKVPPTFILREQDIQVSKESMTNFEKHVRIEIYTGEKYRNFALKNDELDLEQ